MLHVNQMLDAYPDPGHPAKQPDKIHDRAWLRQCYTRGSLTSRTTTSTSARFRCSSGETLKFYQDPQLGIDAQQAAVCARLRQWGIPETVRKAATFPGVAQGADGGIQPCSFSRQAAPVLLTELSISPKIAPPPQRGALVLASSLQRLMAVRHLPAPGAGRRAGGRGGGTARGGERGGAGTGPRVSSATTAPKSGGRWP